MVHWPDEKAKRARKDGVHLLGCHFFFRSFTLRIQESVNKWRKGEKKEEKNSHLVEKHESFVCDNWCGEDACDNLD